MRVLYQVAVRHAIAVDGARTGGQDRFRDPLIRLYGMATDEIFVVCPRCRCQAVVTPRPTSCNHVFCSPRRLVCPGCGYAAAREPAGRTRWGKPVDPFFGFPLWLRAECCGGRLLWAFNRKHLDFLDSYVAALLRERGSVPGSMSMVERLPAWLKSAKHRREVLRVIARLRGCLDRHGARTDSLRMYR